MNKRFTVLILCACIPSVALLGLGIKGCSTAETTPTPTSWFDYPFFPMFELTPFAPTATPSVRPIPPLSEDVPERSAQPIPDWLAAVSPSADSTVPLARFEGICIVPVNRAFIACPSYTQNSGDCYSPLLPLFYKGERVRDYLYLEVNGVIPSELTWQDIIIPDTTHPGTAVPGLRTYSEFCWVADIAAGLYEVVLHYPSETGQASYTWYFATADN
jgi:hypothetical protein